MSEENILDGFVSTSLAVVTAIACAICGYALGRLSQSTVMPRPNQEFKATLDSSDLDMVVGRVTFDGKTSDITARQVIMLNGNLNYADQGYPSAEMVVSTARNLVLEADAEKRGITADDETLSAFMKEMLGGDDYESVAKQYQVDVESLKELLHSSYITQEIRKAVIGKDMPELAAPPTEPGDGENGKATAEYFDYVVKAAGDEWDAKKGAWVSDTGDFAVALGSSKTFDPEKKTATYDDALSAYQVLSTRYSAEASSYDTLWEEYLNGLMSKAQVSVYSLSS